MVMKKNTLEKTRCNTASVGDVTPEESPQHFIRGKKIKRPTGY
jgi:hypothetical protein